MANVMQKSKLGQMLTMVDSLSQEEKVILKSQLERGIWKQEFEDLTSFGEKHFENWCKKREIDYERLKEDDVDRIVGEAIKRNRNRTRINV